MSSKQKLSNSEEHTPAKKNAKQTRIKLKSVDNSFVAKQLDLGAYKIIPYSEDDSDSYYQYVICIIDAGNELEFAQHFDMLYI